MDDKEYAKQKARVQALVDRFHARLGMKWWNVTYAYRRTPFEDSGSGGQVLAQCTARWQYLHAHIEYDLGAVADVDDDELENAFLHEYGHVLVNEMREKGMAHEERVCEHIGRALLWAYRAGQEDGDGGTGSGGVPPAVPAAAPGDAAGAGPERDSAGAPGPALEGSHPAA